MREFHMVHATPKGFFTGGEKTTGNQGGGAREVRNDASKKQGSVGILGRRSGNQYNDKGVQTIIKIDTGTNATTAVFHNDISKNNYGSRGIHSKLVKTGDHQGNNCPNASAFFPNLHTVEKEREKTTNY